MLDIIEKYRVSPKPQSEEATDERLDLRHMWYTTAQRQQDDTPHVMFVFLQHPSRKVFKGVAAVEWHTIYVATYSKTFQRYESITNLYTKTYKYIYIYKQKTNK